jgi:hypothetical protein
MESIEIQQLVEDVLNEKSSSEDTDKLWAIMLREPKWFDYYITLLKIRSLKE